MLLSKRSLKFSIKTALPSMIIKIWRFINFQNINFNPMKKILFSAILMIACCISVFAYKLSNDTVFSGDGIVLRMNSNGTCQVISQETGDLHGSYDITSDRSVEPGCSQVNVVFNFNGIKVYGQIIWPLQEGLMINFDGVFLHKVQY